MIQEVKDHLRIVKIKLWLILNKKEVYIKINSKLINRTKFPLIKICKGKGIDVGCGSDKITPESIGVDIVGRGEIGRYGCEKNKISNADIKASGDNLFMFENDSLDYIISRDNIEHYINFLKALNEWYRILKKGGKIGIATPDDRVINSLKLDPTHKHVFTPDSLTTALNLVGFKVIESGTTIKNWGFYIIAEK